MHRRTFLAATAGMVLARRSSANDNISVAVMGVNGRGAVLAKTFAAQANTDVGYIVDVDMNVTRKVAAGIDGAKGVSDFRRALEDKDVDALVIAAPDHWHAPATLMALDVPYVDIAPKTLKGFATGNGNASKEEMRIAAMELLGLEGPITTDEADAAWLREAVLHLAGESSRLPPAKHAAYLKKIELPEGLT